MKYALRNNGIITGFVIRPNANSDQTPINESSQEWLDYLAPKDLTSASKLGVIRSLRASGDWPAIRQVIHSNDDYLDDWNAASILYINDPLIQGMLGAIGWTPEQLQALFNSVGGEQ